MRCAPAERPCGTGPGAASRRAAARCCARRRRGHDRGGARARAALAAAAAPAAASRPRPAPAGAPRSRGARRRRPARRRARPGRSPRRTRPAPRRAIPRAAPARAARSRARRPGCQRADIGPVTVAATATYAARSGCGSCDETDSHRRCSADSRSLCSRRARGGRGRPRRPALSAAQQRYLALAEHGVALAQARWRDRRRGWYDSRLGDRDRYPLATIWDIVPLFQSLDAIAIASPTPAHRRAVLRFAAGAERYLNRGLRPVPGYSPYPGDRDREHRDLVRRQRLVGPRLRQRLPRDRHAGGCCTTPNGRCATSPRAGWDPGRGRDLVEHRATPTSPARRSPPTRCSRSSLYQQTPLGLRARPGAALPARGRTPRASARPTASTRAARSNPTPVDYIEGPLIYAQATLCRLTGASAECDLRRAPEGTGARRASATCSTSRRSTTRSTCSGCSRSTRSTATATLYRMAADNARDAQTRALDAGRPLPARLERRDALRRRTPGRACSRPTPRRRACSRGWPSTRRRPETQARPRRLARAPAGLRGRAASGRCGRRRGRAAAAWRAASSARRDRPARGRASASAVSAFSIVSATVSGGMPRLAGRPRAPCRSPPATCPYCSCSSGGIVSALGLAAALVPDRRGDRARLDQRDLDAASCAARRAARRRPPRSRAWRPRREPLKPIATRPPIEEMKTIRPRAARSAGSIARVTAICPKTLTSNWRRRSSSVSTSSGPPMPMPGVVDERVEAARPRRPSAAPRSSAAAAICAGSVTSSCQRHDPSRRRPRPPALSPAAGSRTPASTVQPAPRQPQRGRAADAGRGACDQSQRHGGDATRTGRRGARPRRAQRRELRLHGAPARRSSHCAVAIALPRAARAAALAILLAAARAARAAAARASAARHAARGAAQAGRPVRRP